MKRLTEAINAQKIVVPKDSTIPHSVLRRFYCTTPPILSFNSPR